MDRALTLARALALKEAYDAGLLGGETMPEDARPDLPSGSRELLLYLTLPMALNYQRSAYQLWQAALSAWNTPTDRWVFDPLSVCQKGEDELREVLVRHRIALQPNRQPLIWRRIALTLAEAFDGDVRQLLCANGTSADRTRAFLQSHKPLFPYLCGNKICNYWLYVLERYGGVSFPDRDQITVAPDTHVLQASVRLGLLTQEEAEGSSAQALAAERWKQLLSSTDLSPIDLHTPLWLWSRSRFAFPID